MNIGDKHQGFEIIANIENKYVLGYSTTAPCRYVTWYLDADGEPCSGRYFVNSKEAIADFISRGFMYYG